MNFKIKTKTFRLATGAGLLLCAVGLVNAQTSNTIVTFSVDLSAQVTAGTFVPGTDTVAARGTFNGYGQFFLTNNPSGANTNLYSGTTTDTTDLNGGVMQYKYWNSDAATPNGGWESPADGGKNRAASLPSTSGATLVLPTVFFSDAGTPVTSSVTFQVDMAQQINLGLFVPGIDNVYARGDFNAFATSDVLTNDPSILRTNQFGLVSSNVYVGTVSITASPNAAETFKYWNSDALAPGTGWESPSPANGNPDHDGNRFFASATQTLPIVFYSDAPYAPIATNVVTFQVDMSAFVGGIFLPGTDTVDVRGSFNNWTGGANVCTNDPNAANTNIYSTQVTILDGVGATEAYKYTYSGPNVPNGLSWDQPAPPTYNGNRFFTQANATSTVLPPVYFSDVLPNSVLPENTAVTFNVNMTGAKSLTTGTPFDPASDQVFLNGDFLGWVGWDTATLAPYQLIESPVGSTNYTITRTILKGNPLNVTYKYGFYSATDLNAGSVDNEAGFGQNHFRYIRQSPSYTMPTDVFGTMFGEPVKFGNLSAAPATGGHTAISWLGLPGVHLQTRANVVSGPWTDLFNTDGTNWNAGFLSNNGFVSVTNYPTTAGQTYFRLIQPGQ